MCVFSPSQKRYDKPPRRPKSFARPVPDRRPSSTYGLAVGVVLAVTGIGAGSWCEVGVC